MDKSEFETTVGIITHYFQRKIHYNHINKNLYDSNEWQKVVSTELEYIMRKMISYRMIERPMDFFVVSYVLEYYCVKTNTTITQENISTLFTLSAMYATKNIYDNPFNNYSFAYIANVATEKINDAEIHFLKKVNFHIYISSINVNTYYKRLVTFGST